MRKTVVAPESLQSPPACRCSPAEATCMKKGDEASLPALEVPMVPAEQEVT